MHRQRNSTRLKFHLRPHIDFKSFSRFIYDKKTLVATPDTTFYRCHNNKKLMDLVSLFGYRSFSHQALVSCHISPKFVRVQLKHRAGPPETDAG